MHINSLYMIRTRIFMYGMIFYCLCAAALRTVVTISTNIGVYSRLYMLLSLQLVKICLIEAVVAGFSNSINVDCTTICSCNNST